METPAVHFTYFKGRGHGERIRYALAASNIHYTETFLCNPGDMEGIRPLCMFKQCPLLEIDGLRLVQSWSIVRYLAQKNGLLPSAPGAAFKADALAETVRDYTVAGDFVSFGWAPGFFEESGVRASSVAKMQGAAERYLPIFESAIEEGGFITGGTPCWADFQLLYLLNYTEEVLGEGALGGRAKLTALRSTLNKDPRMVAHFALHAQGLVTPLYIAQVRAAMEDKKQ